MKDVMMAMCMVFLALNITGLSQNPDLKFYPDPGIRIENAGLAAPGPAPGGMLWLYHEDVTSGPLVSVSPDGLHFPPGVPYTTFEHNPKRVHLPNGTWKMYVYDAINLVLKSESSTDGITFTSDPGIRYGLTTIDNGTMGVYDHALDTSGGLVMVYVGDLYGVNNIRRAYSPPASMGETFHFTDGDPLGDAGAGGGGNTYVDPKFTEFPDGRVRLFVMKQGDVFSFITSDLVNFTKENGARLRCVDFTEFNVVVLNDPWVIRLRDGRYRMYVTAQIDDGNGGITFNIVSATTRPSTKAKCWNLYE